MPYKDPELRRSKARDQSKQWYASNTTYARKRRREYNKSDVGKACNRTYKKTENGRLIKRAKQARRRAAEGSHTAADLSKIFREQRGRCFYCDEPTPLGVSHADHFVPITLGGTSYRYNIVVSCAACNLRKGAANPGLFMQELGRFPVFWGEQYRWPWLAASIPQCSSVQAVWHLPADCNLVLDTTNR